LFVAVLVGQPVEINSNVHLVEGISMLPPSLLFILILCSRLSVFGLHSSPLDSSDGVWVSHVFISN